MTTPEATRKARNSKRKGATFETDLVTALRAEGFDVERLTKAGKDDEGDLVVRMDDRSYIVIEAKNEARIDIPGYLREAEIERENFIKHRPGLAPERVRGVAVVKARGKGVLESYVLVPFRSYFGISS